MVVLGISLFACFFFYLRYMMSHALERDLWLASTFVGTIHGCSVVVLAIGTLLLDSSNASHALTPLHYLLIYVSFGYFVSDLHVVVCVQYAPVFILHHLFAIIGYTLFLYYQQGAYLLSWAVLLGEITNPFGNLLEMLDQARKKDVRFLEFSKEQWIWAHKSFTLFFTIVRILGLPLFFTYCHVSHVFSQLDENFAILLWIFMGLLWSASLSASWNFMKRKLDTRY